MKRLILFVFILGFLMVDADDALAQRRPGQGGFFQNLFNWGLFNKSPGKRQKKASRAMSNFKGKIPDFGSGKRYLYVGANVNALNYFGDLAPKSRIASTDISFTRPGFGFTTAYKLGPRYAIMGSLNWGRVSASDYQADPTGDKSKYRYARNLSFRNDIYELNIMGRVDLFKDYGTYLTRFPLNPYFFAGIGVFLHNPKGLAPEVDNEGNPLAKGGEWVSLRELGTEGQHSDEYDTDPYGLVQINIPFGLGANYKLTNSITLSYEIGVRYLFTDYIDDVSGNYVDPGALDSDLARTMADRSQEPTSYDGQPRDMEAVQAVTGQAKQFTSKYDPDFTYSAYGGYGNDNHPTLKNRRGGGASDDIYMVNTIRVAYILGGSFKNAKFR